MISAYFGLIVSPSLFEVSDNLMWNIEKTSQLVIFLTLSSFRVKI